MLVGSYDHECLVTWNQTRCDFPRMVLPGHLGWRRGELGHNSLQFSQTHYKLCYAFGIQDAYPWIASYGEADYAFWWNTGGV